MKKNILLGLTGSIACSKAEQFVQDYNDEFNFKIIATHSSLNYLTNKFIQDNDIISDWDDLVGTPHIDLARFADLFIVFPATANFIAKINSGVADDLLTSTILMYKKALYICPAMHEEMFLNSRTQKNLLELSQSYFILGPRYGKLDIGDTGYGRMIEPHELYDVLTKVKEKIIVTSGPTSEPIDDVKVITNKSTGKQGKSIAIELLSRGYEVVYLHSEIISPIPGATNYSFENSKDLFDLMCDEAENTKYIFMVSAVSDFTIEKVNGKISRNYGNLDIGDEGYGRMIEPHELYDVLTKVKEKIIVTSGATSEPIDDVKVITNKSTGKQGKSIAMELLARGYEVVYLHSEIISPIPGATNYSFENSKELFHLMCDEAENTKYIFMVSAVSDFTIDKVNGKISRNNGNLNIEFKQNYDLIKDFKNKYPNIISIAFSAQIDDEENFEKLISKNADYLVINNIIKNPFGSDKNKIKLINKTKLLLETDVEEKNVIASNIIDTIID